MLEVDLKRDDHLDLLDQHLLKLLRSSRSTLDGLVAAAQLRPKLSGLVDAALAERWLDSAQQRYLVEVDHKARWGLTAEGKVRAAPLLRRAGKVGLKTTGVVGIVTRLVAVGSLVKVSSALAVGLPGAAVASNALRYKASRDVVELVASKDKILRECPPEVLEVLARWPKNS